MVKIATHVNSGIDSNLLQDTLESIRFFVTKDILVTRDAVLEPCLLSNVYTVSGFSYGDNKSPYRNIALGIYHLYQLFPNHDWYMYCDYDVVFLSSRITEQLKLAERMGVWLVATNGRYEQLEIPFLKSFCGRSCQYSYYVLGCWFCMHRHFLEKLIRLDFFNKFLFLTSEFREGYFPNYDRHDISEHLYPTMCRLFGGNIGILSSYDEYGRWHGNYRYYPVRWKPEMKYQDEFKEACVVHPVKDYHNRFRVISREKRSK